MGLEAIEVPVESHCKLHSREVEHHHPRRSLDRDPARGLGQLQQLTLSTSFAYETLKVRPRLALAWPADVIANGMEASVQGDIAAFHGRETSKSSLVKCARNKGVITSLPGNVEMKTIPIPFEVLRVSEDVVVILTDIVGYTKALFVNHGGAKSTPLARHASVDMQGSQVRMLAERLI
ncbi:hypothetical protein KF840_19395 [bacterium]|nr:hypothetical protein [bacterium]